MAEQCSSEVTRGIWLSTSGGWILLSSSIMKLYFKSISFFRHLVAIPSLACFSFASPDMSALGIWREYILSLIQSYKALLFLLFDNNGLQLNLHCDTFAVSQCFTRMIETNKKGGGALTIKHTGAQATQSINSRDP